MRIQILDTRIRVMSYLQCPYCENLNPLKTEYLTFCKNCGKKLPNNFSDWQKKHPRASFEDFKRAEAIIDKPAPKSKISAEKQGRIAVFTMFILGFIVAFIGVYIYMEHGSQALDKLSNLAMEGTWESKWEKGKYGNPPLTIESPSKLKKVEVNIPNNIQNLVKDMQSFQHRDGNKLEIVVSTVNYSSDIGSLSLRGAANMGLSNLKQQVGITNFKHNTKDTTVSSLSGKWIDASYQYEDTPLKVNFLLLAQGWNLWQVVVTHEASNESARADAMRALNSVVVESTL